MPTNREHLHLTNQRIPDVPMKVWHIIAASAIAKSAIMNFGSFGQFAAFSQFYLYGKSHFTRTGWEKAMSRYPKPDILEDPLRSLSGHVYMITGANAGLGKEITTYLAKKGATVYMVCRNQAKAQKAREEIVAISKSPSVYILECDCSIESDVRKMWKNFEASQLANAAATETDSSLFVDEEKAAPLRLDGLVCNAGALLNEKTLTTEGVEVRFHHASLHLLYLCRHQYFSSFFLPFIFYR